MARQRQARHPALTSPFSDRALFPDTAPLASYLYQLMSSKKTNLCISADVESTNELLDLAEECGDSICILKTHADIISDFSPRTINGLIEIATRKRFLIFEDREFTSYNIDTIHKRYSGGNHRIASWASFVNAHIFPSPSIVRSLRSAAYDAVSAYNTTVTCEITGGLPEQGPFTNGAGHHEHNDDPFKNVREDYMSFRQRQDDNSDEDIYNGGDISPSHHETIYNRPLTAAELRKGSIVSITTTISSTTEYISAAASPSRPSSMSSELPTLHRGLFLLAQAASADSLMSPEYTQRCIEHARQHKDFVVGFLGQEGLNQLEEDNFLTLASGVSMPPMAGTLSAAAFARRPSAILSLPRRLSVQLTNGARKGSIDGLAPQHFTPRQAILEKGVDVIIAEGISKADDRYNEAEQYRKEGWNALCQRWGVKP